MRIRLTRGKQKELIYLAKEDLTWMQLAKLLYVSETYLSRDLKNEKILISEQLYKKLCEISKTNFDEFIVEKLGDNWGRSKGGINSNGSTIKLIKPTKNEKLSEFIGAVLGDGNIHSYKKGKKVRVYQIKIAGDYIKDKDYHKYLSKLSKEIFNLNPKEVVIPNKNERFLNLYSKQLIDFFNDMGIKSGNKIINQSTIPNWIWKKEIFLRACLRGLIDTDGSIFRMSKKDFNLIRISFTNCNKKLLEDTRKGFIVLGFNPSKIVNNKQFFLSRKNEIKEYLKVIGFSNKKHIDRVKSFIKAPSSSGQG